MICIFQPSGFFRADVLRTSQLSHLIHGVPGLTPGITTEPKVLTGANSIVDLIETVDLEVACRLQASAHQYLAIPT